MTLFQVMEDSNLQKRFVIYLASGPQTLVCLLVQLTARKSCKFTIVLLSFQVDAMVFWTLRFSVSLWSLFIIFGVKRYIWGCTNITWYQNIIMWPLLGTYNTKNFVWPSFQGPEVFQVRFWKFQFSVLLRHFSIFFGVKTFLP